MEAAPRVVSPLVASDVSDPPHPLKNQIAQPLYTSEEIASARTISRGALSESKEQYIRFQACQWISSVSEHLRCPVRTTGMAMVLYHRFHLFFPIADFVFSDTAAACLFVACKMQDTLKKLREILLAAYQVRHPNGPQISIESQTLEDQRKRLIGLERMVLETSCFDFRFQHPQPMIIKISRNLQLSKMHANHAWDISVDSYKTFIPVEFPCHIWALGCLDLAARVLGTTFRPRFSDYFATLEAVQRVTAELLSLYMYHGNQTILGAHHDANKFMEIRIDMNKSSSSDFESKAPDTANGTTRSTELEGPSNGRIGDKGTVRYILF